MLDRPRIRLGVCFVGMGMGRRWACQGGPGGMGAERVELCRPEVAHQLSQDRLCKLQGRGGCGRI